MRYLMIPGLVLLIGCQSAAQERIPVPATLSEVDNESHTLLALGISRALGGVPVTLSPSAFTHSSRLFIDSPPPGKGMGPGSNGKKLVPARMFELLTDGETCFLKTPVVDEPPLALPGVRCRAISIQ